MTTTIVQESFFGDVVTLESPQKKQYPLVKKGVKIHIKVVEKIGYKYQPMHLMSDGTTKPCNMHEVFVKRMSCQGVCNVHNLHHGWSRDDVSDVVEATGYIVQIYQRPVQAIV